MHTQLGSAGSAATGTAAGLSAMMRKGKMQQEPINVIAFCGDGGGADMVIHEPAGGGAVFSVGSICWPSSLPVDPAVAQITANVIRRFQT